MNGYKNICLSIKNIIENRSKKGNTFHVSMAKKMYEYLLFIGKNCTLVDINNEKGDFKRRKID